MRVRERNWGSNESSWSTEESGVYEQRFEQKRKNAGVYTGMIVPILTYEAESLVLNEIENQRLQVAEIRVLRKIV